MLAECRYGATAFGAAVNGLATANAITQDSAADATGTPTFFRAFKSDGTTAVFDGSVGLSGSDANINAVPIQQNAIVSVTSQTYQGNKG